MTEQIFCESLRKILKDKKQLESSLKVKLESKGKVLIIDGKAEDELLALSVIESMTLGFSIDQALDLKQEGFTFSKIEIKSISHRKDMSQVRARVIGRERKALNTIEDLTGCSLVLHNNTVGIIGEIRAVEKSEFALRKLIKGSKHSNVYHYLEEENAKERLEFH